MKLRPWLILSIVALLLMSGCATVTFKRGAGPGGAKADEDACRAASASQEAYVDCLRQRGWLVGGKAAAGSTEPTAAAPADMRGVAAQPAVTAPSIPTGPAPPPGPPVAEPASARARRAATESPPPPAPPAVTSGLPAATSAPMAPAAATVRADGASAPPPKVVDPTTRVTVSSWWKLGGTAADLDRDIAACGDQLGAAHRPAPGATEVTAAMRDCLRGRKWFPVGGTGAR